jgi:two-component system CheB/CheR fusion protein
MRRKKVKRKLGSERDGARHSMRAMAKGKWPDNLRETEALFRTTVENLPINLVLYSRDYRILYMNPTLANTCARLCGRTPEELVGLKGPELWPKPIWDPLFEHTERAIATREKQTYDLATNMPQHGPSVREWTVVPLIGDSGEVERILTMSTDVTQQRQMVAQLREADQRKSEFIAVLSHELRNPLAAIKSGLHVLEFGAPGSEAVVSSRTIIDRQVAQLVRLVDDLLDVTRITQNKIQLQRKRLDMNELVRATIEDNRPHLERTGVQVEAGLADGPIYVNADSVRLAQVLTNLLANAVKFTPAGGRASVSVWADPAGEAVLRVADTGSGIDPALLPRLFEPFMQADRTLARSGGGLGLGLVLVRGLVELHGGKVSARSTGKGQGAEFIVRLPLDAAAASEARAVLPGGEAGTRRRLLVIEDDPDVGEALRAALEVGGHEVEIASNGYEGIAKARIFRPDVVLCDIGLPGMDGYAVARAFRADELLRRICLVALSGYAQSMDVTTARAAGFDEHLAKPTSIEKVNRIVAGLRASA